MGDLARDLVRGERKKKKKKPQSKGLMIGLFAGGAALVVGVIVLIVVLNSGGGGTPKKEGPDGKDPFAVAPVAAKRPMKDEEALTKLSEIGLAYHAYVDANKKALPDVRQLDPFLKDKELIKMYDGIGSWIELMVNWMPRTLPDGSSKTIVAFERVPVEGKRLVLFGDARTKLLTNEEFEKAPRVNPEGKIVAGPLVLEGGKTRLGKYVRAVERLEAQHVLDAIGREYYQMMLLDKRGPKELSELACARDARVIGALDSKDGWLYVIWGASDRNMPDGPERTIIAYERQTDGTRYVIFGNGRFDVITEEDFLKAPKAKGK
ncbi:MAG: hypothetical protein U0793_26830 [Gemmataceae bacterium]